MFKYFNLDLPSPDFDSDLTKVILELDFLRHKTLSGSTPKHIFFQLKEIFHFLESLGSARIEGNRTTLSEYIETKITPEENPRESILEIQNNERVMDFIEANSLDLPTSDNFIKDCHKIIVEGLSISKEGDKNPGKYRLCNVKIQNSKHITPDFSLVSGYMNELNVFFNEESRPQFDLLKTVICHHRFTWIHPFQNGNGRTVRALTYAMLIKQGFNLEKGRLVNPTAIFCGDRNKYYDMLEKADSGTKEGLLEWCYYVLSGLKNEVEKIDRLTDYTYLRKKILEPAVNNSFDQRLIDEKERTVLMLAIQIQSFQASDIKFLFSKDVAHTEISRFLRKMREKKLIKPITPNSRKYTLEIANGYLLRGVMKALDKNDFLPIKNELD